MRAILDMTSTATTVVYVSRMGTAVLTRIRQLLMPSYQDWGSEGSNKPCADIIDLPRTRRDFLRPKDIGWSRQETLETKAKLAAFEEDWNAPGMEAYDSL